MVSVHHFSKRTEYFSTVLKGIQAPLVPDVFDWESSDVEARNNAKISTAAFEGPEEILVLLRVGVDNRSIREDDLSNEIFVGQLER